MIGSKLYGIVRSADQNNDGFYYVTPSFPGGDIYGNTVKNEAFAVGQMVQIIQCGISNQPGTGFGFVAISYGLSGIYQVEEATKRSLINENPAGAALYYLCSKAGTAEVRYKPARVVGKGANYLTVTEDWSGLTANAPLSAGLDIADFSVDDTVVLQTFPNPIYEVVGWWQMIPETGFNLGVAYHYSNKIVIDIHNPLDGALISSTEAALNPSAIFPAPTYLAAFFGPSYRDPSSADYFYQCVWGFIGIVGLAYQIRCNTYRVKVSDGSVVLSHSMVFFTSDSVTTPTISLDIPRFRTPVLTSPGVIQHRLTSAFDGSFLLNAAYTMGTNNYHSGHSINSPLTYTYEYWDQATNKIIRYVMDASYNFVSDAEIPKSVADSSNRLSPTGSWINQTWVYAPKPGINDLSMINGTTWRVADTLNISGEVYGCNRELNCMNNGLAGLDQYLFFRKNGVLRKILFDSGAGTFTADDLSVTKKTTDHFLFWF